jgi:hypothetical protein
MPAIVTVGATRALAAKLKPNSNALPDVFVLTPNRHIALYTLPNTLS